MSVQDVIFLQKKSPSDSPPSVPSGVVGVFADSEGALQVRNPDGTVEAIAGPAIVDLAREQQTSGFTAVNGGRYLARGTFMITDPSSPMTGDAYDVVVGIGAITIGSVAFAPSRFAIQRMYNGAVWITLPAQITNDLTLSNNLTVNGSDIRLPNGGAAFVDAASVATRDRGDARYASLALMAQQLQFGKFNQVPINNGSFQVAGSVGNNPGIRWEYNSASVNNGSATLREVGFMAGLYFPGRTDFQWPWDVSQRVGVAISFATGTVTSGADGVTARFSVAAAGGATADISGRGYGVRITRSGASLLVVGQTHDGTTLTTSATLATLATNDTSHWCLSYDGVGTLTVFRNGVSIGTVAGGPTTSGTNGAGPVVGITTPGGGVGTVHFRLGANLTITDMR